MISCLGDYFNSAKTKPQQGLSFDRSPNQADNQLRRRTISLDFTAISPPDLQPNEERRLSFDGSLISEPKPKMLKGQRRTPFTYCNADSSNGKENGPK
jgi:hypothetical protein